MNQCSDAAIDALAKRGVTSLPPLGFVLGSGLGGARRRGRGRARHSLSRNPRLSRAHRRRPSAGAWWSARWRGSASRCFRGAAITTSAATRARWPSRSRRSSGSAGARCSSPTPPAACTRIGARRRWSAIVDHINFAGANPLIGLPTDDRFVPMTQGLRPRIAGDAEAGGRARPTSSCTRASTCGFPARASRRRPKSARRKFSAPISWACRRSPKC